MRGVAKMAYVRNGDGCPFVFIPDSTTAKIGGEKINWVSIFL
jgi:hypothetical protein